MSSTAQKGRGVRSAGKSDRGLVRENNEDALLVDGKHGIFLLADGMGGGPGGEVASELAVHAAHELLWLLPDQAAGTDMGRMLAGSLAAAHSAVAKRALADPSLMGMGTTLEIVVVRGGEVSWCHVGDSRIYLFRGGSLSQLTVDDNYAGYLAKNRQIPVDRIPAAYRHILTQAVGLDQELVPEIGSMRPEPGDLFLICSDGLNAALEDPEIEALIARSTQEPAAIADALVAAANARGGPDNVSVIIIEPLQGV